MSSDLFRKSQAGSVQECPYNNKGHVVTSIRLRHHSSIGPLVVAHLHQQSKDAERSTASCKHDDQTIETKCLLSLSSTKEAPEAEWNIRNQRRTAVMQKTRHWEAPTAYFEALQCRPDRVGKTAITVDKTSEGLLESGHPASNTHSLR